MFEMISVVRRRFYIFCISLALNCLPSLLGQQVHAQSLNEALARAYESNPTLEAARAQLRSVDEGVPIALANWRPTVQVNAGYTGLDRYDSGGNANQNAALSGQIASASYGATITEPIYRGGRTVASTNQANSEVRSYRSQLVSTEEQVLMNAITSYLDVVRDDEALALSDGNEKTALQRLESTKARNKAGALSQLDLAQAEADYQSAVLQRYNDNAVAATSRANFERNIGVSPGVLIYPSQVPQLPASESTFIKTVLTENQDLLAAQDDRDAASANVDVLFGQVLPEVDLVVQAQHSENQSFIGEARNDFSAMARLTLNLYDGGALEAQVRQAKETVRMKTYQIEKNQAQALSDARTAWAQSQFTSMALPNALGQVDAYNRALEGTKRQVQDGEGTILDVINAEKSLFQARLALIKLQHDEILSHYKILQVMGMLTARNLDLAVDYYQPSQHYIAVKGKWFGYSDER